MKIKKTLFILCFSYLIFLLLKYPSESVNYAREGLMLWFQTMLPTLMPFMILSTMMVSMHLTDFLGAQNYCIVMGFLCGFPMGAKVIKDLYKTNALSKTHANLLLGFCNNLGPIFVLNYALPTLGIKTPFFYTLGLYGIPFVYGMILLYLYKDKSQISIIQNCKETPQILYHIDDAIQCAIHSITTLGGYMILFNLLNIIPYSLTTQFQLFSQWNRESNFPIRCLFEISGGLNASPVPSIWLMGLLTLGGLSCLAQTYSVIKDTDLSFGVYVKHKCIQAIITMLYFTFLSLLKVIDYA